MERGGWNDVVRRDSLERRLLGRRLPALCGQPRPSSGSLEVANRAMAIADCRMNRLELGDGVRDADERVAAVEIDDVRRVKGTERRQGDADRPGRHDQSGGDPSKPPV